jgi:sugar diacid utilization regulator
MGGQPLPEDGPETTGEGALMQRLRAAHMAMLDGVLAGNGLQRVAEVTASSAGASVAIVVPRIDAVALAPAGGPEAETLPDLRRYAADRVKQRPVPVPDGVVAEVPIAAGDEVIGTVLLLGDAGVELAPETHEFLHLAALASLTEAAIEDAREEVEQNLRSSFLEELRSRVELDPAEVVQRARRLGCDIARGAVVLCAELTAERPRHVVATVSGEYPGALAQHLDGRVYALLPALGEGEGEDEGDATATLDAARRLAERLQRHGTVALSSFYSDPAELRRAIDEAELVLEVLRQSDEPIAQDIGSGTYRLLFRVMASHPEEVRAFFDDTVAPIVRYDEQYATDLVGTLESYLDHNCNMNATAATIYAHRHTVAYRLERVRELTGLDPMQSEDRERLGLGLKAYRIIAPRLPR